MSSPEDRISFLPDDVLSCILSFLPTEEAIRTSVLSRKWRYKWTWICNLIFSDGKRRGRSHKRKRPKKSDFMNFVDRVLFRCKQSNMNKFHLSCFDTYDKSRVETWFMAALWFNVQRLLISYQGNLEFPRGLLCCDSLRELEIRFCTFKISTEVWCYSNLETLILSSVIVSTDDGKDVNEIQLMAPRLVRLEIRNLLFSGSNQCKMEISAERLANFKCTLAKSVNIRFCRPSSIIDASLDHLIGYSPLDTNKEVGFQTCMLLRGFSDSVRCLELRGAVIKVLADAERNCIPIFDKLTHLKLKNCQNFNGDAILIDILKRTPALESLECEGIYLHENYATTWMPMSFLSCLKMAKISNVVYGRATAYGRATEIHLVKFLMRNALALKELQLSPVLRNELLWSSGSSRRVEIKTIGSNVGSVLQCGSSASASSSLSESFQVTDARFAKFQAELAQMREMVRGLSEHIQAISEGRVGGGDPKGDEGGCSGGNSRVP